MGLSIERICISLHDSLSFVECHQVQGMRNKGEESCLRCAVPCCRPGTVWCCLRALASSSSSSTFILPLASTSPHGLPLGPQDRPGDAGRHKTNLTLARATWLLYSANCYQEPLMRNGLATSSCRESCKGCQLGILIMTREHCGGCMSSTFFGQRPLFCVTGHVNTNLSCFWLASNLGSVWWIYWLFLHAFDWVLFPRGLLICTRRKLWSKTNLMYCIWGNQGDKSS